jgi:hypothetical protein
MDEVQGLSLEDSSSSVENSPDRETIAQVEQTIQV